MDPLRITLTIHHWLDRASGAPGVTLALAEAYEKLGHRVEIISFKGIGVREDRLANLVFPAVVAARLARRASDTDVVDSSLADASWWCRLPRGPRPVLLARSHGLEHTAYVDQREEARLNQEPLSFRYRTYRERVNLPRVARTLHRADAVLLLNERERQYALALGVEPSRLHLVAQGVDDAIVDGGARRPLKPSEPTIVSISRFAPSKGTEYLIDALTAVMDADPTVRMRFLGTGSDEEAVLSEFPAHLRSRIEVVPHFARDELVDLVGMARIGVYPSLREGSPVALLELMALGLAPVATAIPGIKEVLTADTGVLVPPRDSAALSHALGALVADPDRAARLGAAAHASVASRRWSRQAVENIARYRVLLDARAGTRAP